MATQYKTIIGRAEPIDFIGLNADIAGVNAKIDTGAYSSSVWASQVREKSGTLEFVLFDKPHPLYTGEIITTQKYQTVTIENSFGESEKRYGVTLKVRFCGKKVESFFTLADRSKKIYPVLVGRKLLRGRYLVDVSGGRPIADEETEENLGYKVLRKRIRNTK